MKMINSRNYVYQKALLEFDFVNNKTEFDSNFVKEFSMSVDCIENEIKSWKKFYKNKTSNYTKDFDFRDFIPKFTYGDVSGFLQSQLVLFKRKSQSKFIDLVKNKIDFEVEKLTNLPDTETFIDAINLMENVIKITVDPTVKTNLKKEIGIIKKLPRNLGFARTIDVTRGVLGSLPNNRFSKILQSRLADIAGVGNFQVINQGSKLISEIAKKIPDNNLKIRFLNDAKNFLFNSQQNVTANTIGDVIKFGVNKIWDDFKLLRGKGETTQTILVDFLFNLVTDYDLDDVKTPIKYQSLTARMRYRWNEFLKKAVFNVNRDIKPSDLFDSVLNVFRDIKNDALAARNIFKFNFQDALFKAINKQLSPFDFNSIIAKKIRIANRQMFRLGLTSYGLDPKDYDAVEAFLVDRLNNVARFFLSKLTDKIANGLLTTTEALIKSDTWYNRILDKSFEYGRLAADRNGLYEWVFGDTKHCPTCLRANGQRHRLKHWWRSGILPKNHGFKNLICEGFHCKCKLVRVTGKARGRLDMIPTK